jgi:hypothetical protein
MYQAIGKNKWDMNANCKYMQNIFAPPLVAFQKTPIRSYNIPNSADMPIPLHISTNKNSCYNLIEEFNTTILLL